MINVPALVFFFVVLVAAFYGLLAVVIWVAGRLAGSAGAREIGVHLAAGAGGVLIAYFIMLLTWLSLLSGGGALGYLVGSAVLLGAPFVVILPPSWAVIQYFIEDS